MNQESGPPRQVDVFTWEDIDDDLRECLEAAFGRARLPGRSYGEGQVHVGAVDFEETGKFHAEWFWRIRPTVQLYGLADTEGDRLVVVGRGAMALLDRPFLQPTAHIDAETGTTHDGREYEVVGRLGVGFARDPFARGLTIGAGAGAIGAPSATALVVPVEVWLDVRKRGGGLVAWARNTFSPAEERTEGAEHATLDATALQLGTGLRVPLLWRGGIMLGIRYDERLGEQRLGVWLGTEWRAARF